jgi:quercetin dioxygenase-like cupin family protein
MKGDAMNDNPWIEICPGIKRQTLTSGASMYQMAARLAVGSKMPEHQHPQEQIVHLVSGRMKLIVNGTSHEMAPGDSFYLASNVPHGVETLEETRVIDTFSPPRDEYLAIDAANRIRR